ncbi:MAG TPA: 2-oxoglutarate dehydrogenase complex dihydrolipoyllysine-residue succinyltransferase [Planctomycetota bacterium]|nr:2-oxoglutarate dehydrogenase complex dihydrolipoyllysine-residue succinyltransferase [Planctomycetota bacterium]
MSVELRVPSVGESITEVQIGDWLKNPGDSASVDEALVVIETDKVTVELPSPIAGRVVQVLKPKGSQAKVGEVIGYMEAGSGAAKDKSAAQAPAGAAAEASDKDGAAKGKREAAPKAPETAKSAETAKAPELSKATDTGKATEAAKATDTGKATESSKAAETAKAPDASKPASASHVMPAAARAIATSGVDIAKVQPTGPGGRTLKEDVQRAASQAPAAAPAAAPAGGAREEEVVPMTPLRKRIAQRLVEAQATAAILTTFNEIDMSNAMALRKEHQERFVARYGIKLGFMSFFMKASIEALKRVPSVNAEVRGDAIAYRNYFDIGIAVGGGKGLVVPVVRNAERLSFAQIEQKIAELGTRAKDNKLTLEELTGGTFTISNGGIYGSLMSTPILNPPQSGILGLHAIQDRAVVVEGQIVVRPMMYVALSYDHRVIDGREAVTFLKTVKECVEDPARMLLEI